jgi:LysR family transcriptional regulator for bpeEF and oprC
MTSRTDKNAMAQYVKVVEAGSFSKAAAREGLPVSTLSRKIAELEKTLGVRLLERSTRRLRMTDIGRDYFELCRRGLTEFEAADALMTDRRTEISGRLRISIPPSMSDLVIVPLCAAFQKVYPKVSVHCLVTERDVDHIADGVDLSLRVGQRNDSSLVAPTVAILRPRLVASPAYLAGIETMTHPQQIVPHVIVAFARWEHPLQWILSRNDDTVRLKPEPRLALNDYAGVQRGVVDGLGISEVPSFICEAALCEGRLVEVLPEWQFATIAMAATYPSNRYLSPLVRAFKDFCVEYFEHRPLAQGATLRRLSIQSVP